MMLKTVLDNLTAEEKEIISSAINNYGDGDHPFAEKVTLPYFIIAFVTYCLGKQIMAMKRAAKEHPHLYQEKYKLLETANEKLLDKLLTA